jgi:hypothetical protein
MVGALEANLAAFLAVAVLGIGALLAGITALSWRRLGHRRLLLVAVAFAVLAAQGAWVLLGVLRGQPADLVLGALDLGVVALLYASVAAR